MASSYVVPDSFANAKDHLRKYLININFGEVINHQIIEEILQKHPDLVHCEYKQYILDPIPDQFSFEKEQDHGFYGTPLQCTSGM